MFNAQGLFADAGEGEKLEDCGGVGDAQGRSLIGINIFKAMREICHFLLRDFILTCPQGGPADGGELFAQPAQHRQLLARGER